MLVSLSVVSKVHITVAQEIFLSAEVRIMPGFVSMIALVVTRPLKYLIAQTANCLLDSNTLENSRSHTFIQSIFSLCSTNP
jgi:hypothetical protein